MRKHPRWKRGVVEENGTPVATSCNPWNGEEQKGSRPVSGFQKVTITRWDPYEATAMHNIIHRFPLLSPCRYTWIRFDTRGEYTVKYTWADEARGLFAHSWQFFLRAFTSLRWTFALNGGRSCRSLLSRRTFSPPFFSLRSPAPPVFLSFSFTFFPPPLFSFLLLFVCIVFSKPLANGSGWVISLGFHDNAEC